MINFMKFFSPLIGIANLTIIVFAESIQDVGIFLQAQNNFNIISIFLGSLPSLLTSVMAAKQSFNRIDQFLKQEEHIQIQSLPPPNSQSIAIEFKNASYSWKEKITLDDEEDQLLKSEIVEEQHGIAFGRAAT